LTALGSSDRNKLKELSSAILSSDTSSALTVTDNLLKLGKSVGLLVKDVAGYLREVLITKTCKNAKDILKLPTSSVKELEGVSALSSSDKILRAIEIFTLTENELKYSSHPRILFETAVIKASKPEEDNDFSALTTRISELEKKLSNLVKNGVTVSKTVEFEPPVAPESEPKEEKKEIIEDKKPTIKKVPISTANITAGNLFGRIVTSLRHNDEIMLWSVVQGASAKLDGNTLIIIAKGEGDEEVIGTEENISLIKAQVPEYEFEVKAMRSPAVENRNKVDEEIENYKKIFGSDIVIVK